MASVIMVYSTTDGHTLKICKRLGEVIEQHGHEVTIEELNPGADIDLGPYERIVIGASIRYGKHQPAVYDFIKKNRAVLEAHPNALFSVNVVARKPEKNTPETNPYLQKFLRQIDWVVYAKRPFAGPAAVLAYLSRYTHRVAIANSRIKKLENGVVSFTAKNRKKNRTEIITISAVEFIRRFLLHSLPKGFVRIRHYGFLANRVRVTRLEQIRAHAELFATGNVPRPVARGEHHDQHTFHFRSLFELFGEGKPVRFRHVGVGEHDGKRLSFLVRL